MTWFLNWLDSVGRKRIVMDRIDNEPYLERYYLFLKDRKRFPFNVFLHKFLKSDPDDVHDHPWSYFTLILKGGYYEWTPQFDASGKKIGEMARWCGPGHFRICSARSFHRIELDPSALIILILLAFVKHNYNVLQPQCDCEAACDKRLYWQAV